ncbi:hypothetical protein QQ008_19900 [Fulvivirgaceae bacterium BMA10]|uniref:Uncharacterized protein n=1 Tax=Splendidivirga corallicola TaxID=3051826 RepID=A0ABT8KU31_9BACT|nr:hypothetical protein [Fulvivirgaceae bacterium BMA10]
MSASKAISFYNSLSPQQKQFIKEKTISSTFTIRKWLGFLNKAVAYDTFGDKALKRMNVWLVVLIVFTVISSIFVTVIVAESGQAFLILLPIILIALIIFQSMRIAKFKHRNLNNYLRLFFFPLLEVLKNKAGENAKLSANLDFRVPRKALTPDKHKVNGRNLKLYQPKHILGSVMLLDGSYLDFIVGDDIKDFSYWKTSSSGKRKYKTKSKIVHRYFIKMTIPKEKYELKSTNLPAEILFSEDNGNYIFKLKGKSKISGKNHVLPVKTFFGSIEYIYSFLVERNGYQTERTEAIEHERDEPLIDPILPMVMWSGGYFDSYDYETFDYEDETQYMTDDGNATIFDS